MRQGFKKIVYFAVIAVILFFGGRAFIFWKIKSTVISKIEELRATGMEVNYSSIRSNSFDGSLTVENLEVDKSMSDSVCASSLTIGELKISGISVFPFLLKKRLSLSSITLNRPWVQLSSHTKRKKPAEPSANPDKKPLDGIEIDLIRIDSGTFQMIDSGSCAISMKARLNFEVKDISVKDFGTDSINWTVQNIAATGVDVNLPSRFYHASIGSITYSRKDKSIQVDSVRLKPTLDRKEFARRSDNQVDQFTLNLPSVSIKDFVPAEGKQLSFIAREIDLGFDLNVYRDKRYERKWRKPKVLPMTFMHKLSFPVKIDSIVLLPSNIVYEEHPEKNDGVGKISFNKLSARIINVSNDTTGESRMKVNTRLMNEGEMNVDFTFPHNRKTPYAVKGSLTNLPLTELNKMLEPAALIKVESGRLQAMNFNFTYNSFESKGQLELRYQDLGVIAIKRDDKSENKIVSFIIKALLKKKIDKSDPIDKRTGTIHWERDPQKAILNYWWKSVLSGIKSVYGFESSGPKEKKK